MKHLKLYEEWGIRIFNSKKTNKVIDLIHKKLTDIYKSDNIDYNVHHNPNHTWDFKIDNDDLYLYIVTMSDNITMGHGYTNVKILIKDNEDLEDEEWDDVVDDNEIITPKIPYSSKY